MSNGKSKGEGSCLPGRACSLVVIGHTTFPLFLVWILIWFYPLSQLFPLGSILLILCPDSSHWSTVAFIFPIPVFFIRIDNIRIWIWHFSSIQILIQAFSWSKWKLKLWPKNFTFFSDKFSLDNIITLIIYTWQLPPPSHFQSGSILHYHSST